MPEQVQKIRTLLREGELMEIENELSRVKEWNKELLVMNIMAQVFRREVENDISPTVFDYSLDLDVLVEHFIRLKLYVRRLEFDLPFDRQMELYGYCAQTGVSDYLLLYIIQKNVFYQRKVCQRLSDVFAEAEGGDSVRAGLYSELAESMEE